jgi:hypothetical protein
MLPTGNRKHKKFARYTGLNGMGLEAGHGTASEIELNYSLANLRTNVGDVLL